MFCFVICQVFAKLGLGGEGDLFSLPEILEELQMEKDQFLNVCVAAGCGYLKNVWGVGVNKAFALVRGTKMFEEL